MDHEEQRSLTAALATALRELRTSAGQPAISWLARRTGFSEGTVCHALAGRRPPSRRVLEGMVLALGADPGPWVERWDELDRARRAARPRLGRLDAAGVKVCEVGGCPNQPQGRWCQKHRVHNRKFGSPTAGTFLPMDHPLTCAVDGCDRTYHASGLCRLHYSRQSHARARTPGERR